MEQGLEQQGEGNTMSVSQFGEHELLTELFKRFPPQNKFLVDVGALGKQFSNTWELLSQGWKGIVIDADPYRIETIRQDFAGLNAEVVHVGVSDSEGELDFHLHSAIGHNSFLSDWYPATATDQSVKVKTRPLADILKERNVQRDFDLLSVDTEGFDERIMKALLSGSEYRPRVVITECTSYADAAKLFGDNGYSFYRMTGNPQYGNLIYVRK